MNKYISSALSRPYTVPALVGITGLGVGLGCGYLWGKRHGEVQIRYVVKTHLVPSPQLNLFDDFTPDVVQPEPDILVSVDASDEGDYIEVETNVNVSESSEKINVFENSESTWSYEAELSSRTEDRPYILHVDEFMADEMDFRQTTLTYYAGDHILVDEADVPLYNHETLVGELRFGHGSNDKNVVYVRNEKLHQEWGILWTGEHYQVAVLGVEIEHDYEDRDLKHSAVRRFRSSD